MALRRKAVDLPPATPPQEVHRRSLVAAAARITNLEGRAFQAYKFGDDSWQPECWRLYDVIGELRFVANWVGSACSRVRIYVAEVDENGRIQQMRESYDMKSLTDQFEAAGRFPVRVRNRSSSAANWCASSQSRRTTTSSGGIGTLR